MTSRKNIFILRLINTLLFLFLLVFQYNGIFTIKIMYANPMLPIALLVCTCMFSSELTASISGLLVGIFIDGVAATPPGFNSILLFILGFAISLVVRHLFNNNILSAIALCVLCSLVYFLIRWLVCIAFSITLTENLTYLLQTVFPSVLYTAVFSIPFYFLEKKLYHKFYK